MPRPPYIPRRTKPVGKLPVMAKLRDEFGMVAHLALRSLETAPTIEAFDALAEAFNLLQVDLRNDARRSDVAAVISDGAGALIAAQADVDAGRVPAPDLLERIRAGVNAIDGLLGKLDVTRLYASMQVLKAMKREAA